MYVFIALIRRTLLIVWLLAMKDFDPVVLSSGMLFIQVIYYVHILIARPFDRKENNLVEIVNETIYLVMITIIVAFDKSSEWSDTIKTVYGGIIMGNSAIITVIMIGIYSF